MSEYQVRRVVSSSEGEESAYCVFLQAVREVLAFFPEVPEREVKEKV